MSSVGYKMKVQEREEVVQSSEYSFSALTSPNEYLSQLNREPFQLFINSTLSTSETNHSQIVQLIKTKTTSQMKLLV